MKSKPSVAVIAVIAVVVALAGVLGGWLILSQKNYAPELTVTTLSGQPLSLTQLRGKVVLVNFWATTCSSCVEEMPRLVETHKAFSPAGYETIAIAMADDRPDWVINFSQQRALPFKVALDVKGDAAKAFGGVRMTPTSFLIDKQGRIVQKILGAPDFAKFNGTIKELLGQPA